MSEATKTRLASMILALAVIILPIAGNAAHPAASGDSDVYFAEAKVTDVQPIVRIVQVSTPREVCWDEPVRQTNLHRSGSRQSFVPTVLGGIIGGVVGNHFGGGRGKDAMTVAGVLLGASVGRDAGYRGQQVARRSAPQYVSARRCEIEESVHEEERIEGYRVTYRYQGRDYVTRMHNEPGRNIRVRVRVRPAA